MSSSVQVFIYISSLLIIVSVILADELENHCVESRCNRSSPVIRFPFRLMGHQPNECGYPGFDLTCTNDNKTLLELPNSIKVFVKNINYSLQTIDVIDPGSCIPKLVKSMNLANSPFRLGQDFSSYYYSLFNCSSTVDFLYWNQVPCLSTPGFNVFAAYYQDDILDIPLSYCTKMCDVPGGAINSQTVLSFSWFQPSCEECEKSGGACRLDSQTTPNLKIECLKKPKPNSGSSKKLVVAGASLGAFMFALATIQFWRIVRLDKVEREHQRKIEKFLDDYRADKPSRYSYADVKRITCKFQDKLGQGAYGTVYKGKLSNEVSVAVKILDSSESDGDEFINEVATMGRIHHVNVVRLVGFCADGFRRALIYEFLPNGSLEKIIYSRNGLSLSLGWQKAHNIALGIARGIKYLHQGCDKPILHFDIKPHNVLLDQDFNPKISDFGQAKLCFRDKSHVSMTAARGTMGYMAPEVFSRNFGNVSYKSDVYSFGMLLLEMVGGRKVDAAAKEISELHFPAWIYDSLEGKDDTPSQIHDDEQAKIVKKLTIVGLRCIQWYPVDRPSMNVVVQMLEGEEDNLTIPPNPFASTCPSSSSTGSIPRRPFNQELPAIPESE
ncbi:Wall-associated receptor kinase, galacturonan-binding domain [Dillenia turbinata]|uniref:Wall-associated receptor kinase, galacturonan-binding domain n=1 Tax=Dillenia turbinata TaxID=194707 RepID=A0AAN8Z869_9MAGN